MPSASRSDPPSIDLRPDETPVNTPAADSPDANPLLTAALAYAARGWRVVPLHGVDVRGCSCGKDCGTSAGKHPRIAAWQTAATTDAGQIRGWWGRWPRANVGVALGTASGIVGLDIDSAEGERVLADLAGGDLPPTVELVTGNGRRLLYAIPPDLPAPPRTRPKKGSDNAETVRWQSDGGQCVMPPSTHYSGRTYSFKAGHAAGEVSPPFMPAWLVREMCEEPPPKPVVVTSPPRPVPVPAEPDRAAVHRRAKQYLDRCPEGVMNERGSDPTFWAARVLVQGFCLDQAEAFALLDSFFNPRCRPPWSEKELRHKVKEAAERPFNKPRGWLLNAVDPAKEMPWQQPAAHAAGQGGGQTPPPVRPWEQKVSADGRPTGMSAVALVDKEFPPPKWAVEGLLPEGLTVLGGAPKAGKSWLSLLVGWAVAAGGDLDGRKVTGGDVLYLALEDTYRRLKGRLLTLRKGVEYPIPERLTLAINWPRADAEGLQHIAEWLDERKDTARLVIVDTLAMFRKVQSGKGNSYAEDYDAVGGLKRLLDHYGVCGMVNHHTRKMKSADPFDDISGTQGIAGSADSMWVLDGHSGRDAQLFHKGRDLEPGTVPLTFVKEHCRWQLGETVGEILAHGRGDTPATSRAKACEAWLREYLREFARPSAEIEQASKDAGYSFHQLRDAKAKMGGKGTGELTHKNFGKAGEKVWWSGFGPVPSWRFPANGPRPPGLWAGKGEPRRRDLDGPGDDDDGGF